jgi:hypothetical protein
MKLPLNMLMLLTSAAVGTDVNCRFVVGKKDDNMENKQMASFDTKERATYSAWHVDLATQVCLSEDHEIGAPHAVEMKP